MAADTRRRRRLARLAAETRRPPLQGPPAGRRRPHRRRAGRPAPQPLHRRLHHARARPVRRAPGAQPRRSWRRTPPATAWPSPRTARPPWPRSSSQRQLEHGAWGITAAVPHQVRVCRALRRSSGSSSPTSSSTPAALRWLAARAGRRPRLPLRLLRRLRARRRADGRGAAEPGPRAPWTSSSSSARARAPAPASARRRSAPRSPTRSPRHRGRCGWSASRATRARCRRPTPSGCAAWLRRLVALAADFDKAGRFADAGRDRRQRGRQRLVRRGRRGLRRDPRTLPCPY